MVHNLSAYQWTNFVMYFSPAIALLCGSIIMAFVALISKKRHSFDFALSLSSILISFVLTFWIWRKLPCGDFMSLSLGRVSIITWIFIDVSAFASMVLVFYGKASKMRRMWLSSLVLAAAFSTCIISSSVNLVITFAALSILIIVLSAAIRFGSYSRDLPESSFKFFILASFALAFFAFGIAFIFGGTGGFDLVDIAVRSGKSIGPTAQIFFLIGRAISMIFFMFMLAIVPFYSWFPDVYDGSPLFVGNFISGALMGSIALFTYRFYSSAFLTMDVIWHKLFLAASVLTMLWGCVTAMKQDTAKRMLSYIIMINAGMLFIVIPASVSNQGAVITAVLFCFAFNAVALSGMHCLLGIVSSEGHSDDIVINGLAGMVNKRPYYAMAFVILLAALVGIPPLMGFMLKYSMLSIVFKSGHFVVGILVLCISIAAFYIFIRPAVVIYLHPLRSMSNFEISKISTPRPVMGVIIASIIFLLFFGLFPEKLLQLLHIAGV